MKKILVAVLASLLVNGKYKFTAAEYNMMYHTDDLPTKQFSYVDPAFLSFAYRVEKNAEALNKILADVMCIVEWNGNDKSPYFLDAPDILLAKLKEVLSANKIELNDSVFIGSEKNFKAQLPGGIEEKLKKELTDRFAALTQARKIKIFQGPYRRLLTQKSSGFFVFEGEKQQEEPVAEPRPADSTTFMQSLLFAYNSDKFELDGAKEVYATARSKTAAGIDSQNFIVQRLKLKSKNPLDKQKLTVICSHFKSKKDGIDYRVALGREISTFIANDRKKNKNADYILMGDLNAEVHEIAFDLSAKILRLSSQRNELFALFPSEVYSPSSISDDLDERILSAEMQIAEITAYYKGVLKPYDKNDAQVKKSLEGPLSEITRAKGYKEKLPLAKEESLGFWVEANNFATERKIRVDEIKFDSARFLALMNFIKQEHASSDDESGLKGFGCLDAFNAVTNGNFAKTELSKEKVLKPKDPSKFDPAKLSFEDSAKYLQQIKKAFFNDALACLGKIMAEEPNKETAKYALANKVRTALIQSLIEEEKIDFVLLNFSSDFTIDKVEKIEDSQESREVGAPNSVHPSDHFPSRVSVHVGEKNKEFELEKMKALGSVKELKKHVRMRRDRRIVV